MNENPLAFTSAHSLPFRFMGKDKMIADQNWPAVAIGLIRVKLGNKKRIATVDEAAKLIGTSRANVYKWVNARTMVQAGYTYIKRVAELSELPEAWLAQEPRRRDE